MDFKYPDTVLRPVDIVVALKLSLSTGDRSPYLHLANDLCLYPSEVYISVKRLRASYFLERNEIGADRLNRSHLLEFLVHGIRYAFPAVMGAMTRGVPTRYAAPPLRGLMKPGDEPPPVWPSEQGTVRGVSLSPLHKNVPQAALKDPVLYEMLSLVDAMRAGRARERELAGKFLSKHLGSSVAA